MASAEDFGSRIPVVGGLLGWESDAEKDMQNQLRQMAAAYQRYRPQAANMIGQGLNAQLNAWAPVQQYIGGMLPGIDPFNARQAMGSFQMAQLGLMDQGATNGKGPAAIVTPGRTAAEALVPYGSTGNTAGQVNPAGDAEWDAQQNRWVPRRNI
jgi:hypothetical protein